MNVNGPIIPRTPMQDHYNRVRDMSYEQRIAHADLLLRKPDLLASDFAESVEIFKDYQNLEGFYSNKNRRPPTPSHLGQITKTQDVAWYLSAKPELTVVDASTLSAKYVDYEIAPARTTGRAQFEDGGSWRSGIFIDLILANYDDRTPIIAELKIKNDKDPFTALIQVLANSSLCVSPSQYLRFRNFLKAGRFRPNHQPRVDSYILLHRFLSAPQPDLERLVEQSKKLSQLLMSRSEIAAHVRRIVCLDIELSSNSEIVGTRRWCYGE
jgi:hypothetical protein